jgi:hypothetical protein
MYGAGLRKAERLSLRIRDIDFGSNNPSRTRKAYFPLYLANKGLLHSTYCCAVQLFNISPGAARHTNGLAASLANTASKNLMR